MEQSRERPEQARAQGPRAQSGRDRRPAQTLLELVQARALAEEDRRDSAELERRERSRQREVERQERAEATVGAERPLGRRPRLALGADAAAGSRRRAVARAKSRGR